MSVSQPMPATPGKASSRSTGSPNAVTIVAIYQFARIPDVEPLRQRLQKLCKRESIVGTILLATEGINGTVAGTLQAIDNFLHHLKQEEGFAALKAKRSIADCAPFHRLKVKVKPEIVTMGIAGIDPAQRTGEHVDARRWNELLKDPQILTIDTRNEYEYRIGTFHSAISPHTSCFREFPQFVSSHLNPQQNRKIAMFCTGGIRCEKASAYLLQQGFEEVYQLDGGILSYLEQKPEESLWQGECFVFDGRVAVNRELAQGSHFMCYGCRRPLSEEDSLSEKYEAGVSCPHCYCSLSDRQRASFRERWRQEKIARDRQQKHVGGIMPRAQQSWEAI